MKLSVQMDRSVHTKRVIKVFRLVTLVIFMGMMLFSMLGKADAHATMVQTTPAENSQMDVSPGSVDILFNEKLDSGGAKLLVLNDLSRNVAKGKPVRIEENKGLSIALPKLSEGHYTVSYSVISADGHPVSGAYIFTIGNPAPLKNAAELDPHQQLGHANHGSSGLSSQSFLLYASRIMYYAGLLAVAGLALWSLLQKKQSSLLIREVHNQSLGLAGKFTMVATLAYVFFSLQDLAQGEPLSEWGRILTDTTIGKLYIAMLLLALVAVVLSKLGLIVRLIWVVLALFVEAWSGHAAAYDPIAYTMALDWLHLAAASLWSGGLILLLAIWLRERPEAGRFALQFSKWALISFILLWVTGILSTLEYIPTLDYLLYTAWGKWLIAKAAISLLVVITAFLIRLRMKKGELPHGFLLKIDVGLLAAIVLTVGILTYQSPLPANEPINFHKMGTEMHVTLRVSPNTPGDNRFTLKIWLPESVGEGAPKKVQLRLLPLEREDMGYIDVPLVVIKDEEMDGFPDFVKSAYSAEGPFLPFAGEWKYQIRVTDSLDNERVVETTSRIY
jgi:copper transport protein